MRTITLTEAEHTRLAALLDELLTCELGGFPKFYLGAKSQEDASDAQIFALRTLGHKLAAAVRT